MLIGGEVGLFDSAREKENKGIGVDTTARILLTPLIENRIVSATAHERIVPVAERGAVRARGVGIEQRATTLLRVGHAVNEPRVPADTSVRHEDTTRRVSEQRYSYSVNSRYHRHLCGRFDRVLRSLCEPGFDRSRVVLQRCL